MPPRKRKAPSKPIKKAKKPKKSQYKVATWKRAKVGKYYTFHDIKNVGRIYEPLEVGILENKRVEENRIVFEFNLNGWMFDAVAFRNNGIAEKNSLNLKENCSYVIKGGMRAQTKSTKYDRSSNSSNANSLVLYSEVTIVEKRATEPAPETNSLIKVNEAISNEEFFSTQIPLMTLSDGEIYRYMGCEKCSKSIPKPDPRNNKFYCTHCKIADVPKNRRVCMIIRKLQVCDSSAITSDLVMYHKDVQKIFGDTLTDEICRSFSDIKGKEEFEKIKGSEISGYVFRQRPTKSKSNVFNIPKLILKDVQILVRKQQPAQSATETGSEDFPTFSELPAIDSDIERGVICTLCEDGNDEDDAEDAENQPLQILNFDVRKLHPLQRENGGDRQYQLTRSASGHYGLALIININTTTDQKPRPGSQQDVNALTNTFPKLGIEIFRCGGILNPTRPQFKDNILPAFKKQLVDGDYSSCFVVYMGHGYQNSVKLGDGERISIYKDFMYKFSDEDFPEFCGKPKVFFYQACQNIQSQQQPFDCPSTTIPNTLWVTPCLPGQTAKRNVKGGSYFIQELTKALIQHQQGLRLHDILHEVQIKLSTYPFIDTKTHKACFRIPVISNSCFGRFFFPVKMQ